MAPEIDFFLRGPSGSENRDYVGEGHDGGSSSTFSLFGPPIIRNSVIQARWAGLAASNTLRRKLETQSVQRRKPKSRNEEAERRACVPGTWVLETA
jgi:hypothetical protein